jgi:hypothetical protein
MIKRTWSPRNRHYTTDFVEYYSGFRTAIVTVSSLLGLVNAEIYKTVTNEENFIDYIPKLSSAMGNEPFFLFMDRLSVHRMKTVKEKLQEHGITPIYNCSASPDLNAIETCFAQVKLKYKKNRCIALMHRE